MLLLHTGDNNRKNARQHFYITQKTRRRESYN